MQQSINVKTSVEETLNAMLDAKAERNRPLKDEYPYVYVDGFFLKRCWVEEYENISILFAIDVSSDGYREIIGAAGS